MSLSSLNRITAVVALTTWALAAALLAAVLLQGPVEGAGLVFDRLTAALVVLVTGVSAIAWPVVSVKAIPPRPTCSIASQIAVWEALLPM